MQQRATTYQQSKQASLCGQATVEAAFLIPVLLIVLLMLIQPAIILYDRMVMNEAASETCRVLATRSGYQSGGAEVYEAFTKRRLAAIPQQDNFHIHSSGDDCSYRIELSGDESQEMVRVVIENKLKLLPFFDFGGRALGIVDDAGAFTIRVEVQQTAYNSWVVSNEQGLQPHSWVEQWAE